MSTTGGSDDDHIQAAGGNAGITMNTRMDLPLTGYGPSASRIQESTLTS